MNLFRLADVIRQTGCELLPPGSFVILAPNSPLTYLFIALSMGRYFLLYVIDSSAAHTALHTKVSR